MKPLRFLTALWTLLLLTGCGDSAATAEEDLPCRTEVMAMDTIMTLSVYNQPAEEGMEVLRKAIVCIEELEALLSVTDENSEIYQANHAGSSPVSLSEDTRELLEEALALCGETGGALDVTVYPVVRAWGFTAGDYRVPEAKEVSALLEKVGYDRAELDGDRLTLPE